MMTDTFESIGNIAARVVEKTAYRAGFTEHEDGIYFGMSDTVYHADTALGSTGIKKLISNAPDFWWDSWMNPAVDVDTQSDALKFGRQLHKCVIEGADEFVAFHAPQFNAGNTKAGKLEIEEITMSGKTPVKFQDYQRILAASAFIKANKTLASAFEGGMPEVSVFWTENGLRFKARFDYLKIRAITDLKSITNIRDKEFGRACKDAIASYNYLISAAHYCEGRKHLKHLLDAGKVFGSVDHDWLQQVASNQEYAFVFVFWQRSGAPISHGIQLSPNNPLFAYGRSLIA